MSLSQRHETFAALHRRGCFVIPNPWDAGTARMAAAMGAKALATSSAAHAFALGRPDGQVSRDEALAHAQEIVAATALPVSGDFENGFGDSPGTVAETVRLGAEAGLSGLCIEDIRREDGTAYPFAAAVERVRAGVAEARALGRPFVFCARADGVMRGTYDLAEGIRRLRAYEEAGADLLYLPMPPDRDAIALILASVGAPVNVLAAGSVRQMRVAELARMGVRRISTGSQILRVSQAAIRDALAAMLGDEGSFAPLMQAAAGGEMDALLARGAGD